MTCDHESLLIKPKDVTRDGDVLEIGLSIRCEQCDKEFEMVGARVLEGDHAIYCALPETINLRFQDVWEERS